jgi:hypothetical protein
MKFSDLLELVETETVAPQLTDVIAPPLPSFAELHAQAQAQLDAEIARAGADLLAAVKEHERALLASVLRTS